MANHNATDAVSRRNVLKATGGLMAGSTLLAGLGAGRGAASPEVLHMEVEEANEEVITVLLKVPEVSDHSEFPGLVYLGHVDQFGIDGDTVRLPEDTDGLATPVEMEQLDEATYRVYFHTADIDFSEVEGEEVTLGLGVFTERTIPKSQWDTVTIHHPVGRY